MALEDLELLWVPWAENLQPVPRIAGTFNEGGKRDYAFYGQNFSMFVTDQFDEVTTFWGARVKDTDLDAIAHARGTLCAKWKCYDIKILRRIMNGWEPLEVSPIFCEIKNPLIPKLKRWVTHSKNPCELCLTNEAQGPIPDDQVFKSGDLFPPAHLNCRCTLEYV